MPPWPGWPNATTSKSEGPAIAVHAGAPRWPLLRHLAVRDLAERYAGSFSGLAWLIVQPVALLTVYTLVFEQIFNARFAGNEATGFVPMLALGLWPWMLFAEGSQRASSALTDNAALLGKVAMSPLLLVLARLLAHGVVIAVGFGVVLVVLAMSGTPLDIRGVALCLLWWLPLMVLTIGLGLALAVLEVFVRDLKQGLPLLFTLGFFLSPVLYSSAQIEGTLGAVLGVNPLRWPLEGIRAACLEARIDWIGWLLFNLVSIGVLAAGLWLYLRLRPQLDDFL